MPNEIQTTNPQMSMSGVAVAGNSIVAFAQVKSKAGEIFAEGKKIIKQVREFEITMPEDLSVAQHLLKRCQEVKKDAEAKRTELVKPVNDYVSEINALFKLATGLVDQSKIEISQKMVDWEEKQRKIREEAEAKAKAEREAEEARIREEQAKREAEIKAKQDEADRKLAEEKAKMSAEAAALAEEKAKIEKERLALQEETRKLEEAKKLDELKKQQEMDARIAEKQTKVKGMRKVMSFDVVDPNLVPRNYCSPDDKKIRAALKLGITEIPGLKIYETARVQ